MAGLINFERADGALRIAVFRNHGAAVDAAGQRFPRGASHLPRGLPHAEQHAPPVPEVERLQRTAHRRVRLYAGNSGFQDGFAVFEQC